MLRVTYEAVDDLEPGRLAEIDEDRGRIQIRVDRTASIEAVVQQLNRKIDRFLATSHWYQLWKDEIISRGHSASLRVVYLLEREEDSPVCVKEGKGLVRVYIDPVLTTAEFAAAMNPAAREILDGRRWFQEYAGEIIDMSPEPMIQVS